MITDSEKKVMDLLVEAHNEFIKLPEFHSMETAEWASKLHDMQRIIMCREAVRQNPEIYAQD